MRILPLFAFAVLASCSQAPASSDAASANATYKANLATAQAANQAHIDADYDTWKSFYTEDAVIWDATYGSQKMTVAKAAETFAGHHAAIDGIRTAREVWLPGVDTLNLQADGSVRAYIDWNGTSKANGHELELRAYHYWNFDEAGKINQQGDFYDAGGLLVAAIPPPPAKVEGGATE